MKQVTVEPIQKADQFKQEQLLSREEVKAAIELALEQILLNTTYFGEAYPSPAASDDFYSVIENIEWTNGFWTGLLWLSYEYSSNPVFKDLAQKNTLSFLDRVQNRIELDHHDLGFLYSPSCVADYKLTGSPQALVASIKAADKLLERYQEVGEFIQAWGVLGKAEDYRLIIDCLLNLQLLFFASETTGKQHYSDIAMKHFYTSVETVIRDDSSTFHTYYFDPQTGKPLKGVTRQGYSDDSSWARGQAWGIYGIPLIYRKIRDEESISLFKGVTNYFLNRLPKDSVSYWDLIFSDGSGQARDSSATAVAVCGIHEMLKYLPETDDDKLTYKYAMHGMLRSLIEYYSTKDLKPGKPILEHGVYSWHSGKGVDQGNIWGDYYYLEALIRFYKDWDPYW